MRLLIVCYYISQMNEKIVFLIWREVIEELMKYVWCFVIFLFDLKS